MARSRQRRKERQRDRQAEAPANGGVAEELQDEADAAAEPGDGKPGITADDVSMSEEAREEFDRGLDEQVGAEDEEGVSASELIGAIGPLRRTRRHSLLPGIRMFTAMLEEARGGYAADRLEQMEEALGLDFTGREQEGILQISMAAMDETGVPDVEHGVQMALEARAQVDAGELDVAEDHGDGREATPASTDDTPGPFEPTTEEARRLAASGASQEDVEAMEEQVLEARREEDAATAEPDEPDDPDAPGPDEG